MARFRTILTSIGVSAAHPAAFAVVGLYAAAWLIFDRHTLDWQGVDPSVSAAKVKSKPMSALSPKAAAAIVNRRGR
jgi:hypothetical protein